MPQHGAHITQTLQPKPSIFEVVAADSLQSTFYPALKRVANYLINLNPERYGWCLRYYDEVYLIINTLIQQHYIRTYGGSLSEIFYSLTRVNNNTDTLNKRDRILAFFEVAILPYLISKLNALIERWREEYETGTANDSKIQHKKQIITIYKTLKASHDVLQIFQYLAYLSDRTKSHSVVIRLLNMSLNYLPPETNLTKWSWSDLFTGKFRNTTIFTGIVFRTLELSAFFLQFVQWWQNETTHGNIAKLPNPEAPTGHTAKSGKKYEGICPICLQKWKIPTANRISGYVFCYKCIMKHLEKSQVCPVTKYATSIDDLVRIFDI